nr:D-alanyl-D-alanine carboxypeptidase [Verrucomicrobiota bacterium]
VEAFANRMNLKARAFGMNDSNFLNPNGLPAPGQYSTARDMTRLALVAYQNPIIRDLVRKPRVEWHYNDGRVKEFTNTNRVLKSFPFCNGMKTGYTEASGFCLISSASNGERAVIAVVLGNTRDRIWTDSHRLLAWGLSS